MDRETRDMLLDTAGRFFTERCGRDVVNGVEKGVWPADLWKEIATLGWPGLLVPTELGGSGGSVTDALALVEELGRACFPGPFIPSAIVATTALTAAGGPRARALLPALAVGERICALAVLEESGRLDPDALTLRKTAVYRPDRREEVEPRLHRPSFLPEITESIDDRFWVASR